MFKKMTAILTISTLGNNAFSYQQVVSGTGANGLEKAIHRVRKNLDHEYVIVDIEYVL